MLSAWMALLLYSLNILQTFASQQVSISFWMGFMQRKLFLHGGPQGAGGEKQMRKGCKIDRTICEKGLSKCGSCLSKHLKMSRNTYFYTKILGIQHKTLSIQTGFV
jgi:hypothetical protein